MIQSNSSLEECLPHKNFSAIVGGMGDVEGASIRKKTQTLAVHADVAKRFGEWCANRPSRIKVSMNDAASAILDWFLQQEDIPQRVAMGEVPWGMEEDYARALDMIAETLRRGRQPKFGLGPKVPPPPRDAPLRKPEEPPPPKHPRRK